MAVGTTLIAFKQALLTKLADRPALADVQISYGRPAVFTADDTIWLGEAAADVTLPAMRGTGVFVVEEDFRLAIHIVSLTFVDDGEAAADARAAELLAEVQQELAETPKTIPDIMLAEFVAWEHSTEPVSGDASGYGSRFNVLVRVRARIPSA